MPSANDATDTDTGESADGWAGGRGEHEHGEDEDAAVDVGQVYSTNKKFDLLPPARGGSNLKFFIVNYTSDKITFSCKIHLNI